MNIKITTIKFEQNYQKQKKVLNFELHSRSYCVGKKASIWFFQKYVWIIWWVQQVFSGNRGQQCHNYNILVLRTGLLSRLMIQLRYVDPVHNNYYVIYYLNYFPVFNSRKPNVFCLKTAKAML